MQLTNFVFINWHMIQKAKNLALKDIQTTEKYDIMDLDSANIFHNYFLNNYEKASLKDMAKKLNYTPTYLSTLLKKEFNKGFCEILKDYRFKKACELLINTDEKLFIVAKEVGYSTYSGFFRAFIDRFNISPQDFRDKKG